MSIKRASIENLKSRVSLLDVAGRYTQLKKRGHAYVGLSPFTKEKTPSFTVDADKNVFYCFSSNQGGDLISFVQKMEHLEFYEAVEALAERYNIELEYEEGSSDRPRVDRSLKKELLEIHLYATEFFQKAFNDAKHPEAVAVRDYWQKERKFSLEVAKEFGVGYAPVSPHKLLEMLVRKKFSNEALAQCGLYFTGSSRDAGSFKPRFRGRLMVPLRDMQGNVIAFTGRKLPCTPADDPAFEAKYVNSPETLLFKKGSMLFNFDRARMGAEAQGFFLMVEGQLDALRVSSSGYPAVVAPQGTAITPEQLTLIKRTGVPLRVFLDGDRAGQAAALRMLPMALQAEIDLSFLKLPAGVDPDLFFREGGKLDALEEIPPMNFVVAAKFCENAASLSAQARTTALREIFEMIAVAPSAITHEAYVEELGRLLHLSAMSLRRDFEKSAEKSNKALRANESAPTAKKFNKNLTTAEFELLWLLVRCTNLAPRVAEILDADWLDKNENRDALLLNAALSEAAEGMWEVPASLERIAPDTEARDFLYGLLARELPAPCDPIEIANNSIRAIYGKFVERKLDALKAELCAASEPATQAQLLKKQQNLLILKKKIPYLHHV